MALFKCPECSSMISECADSCPHCGFPLADYYRWVKYQRSFGFDPLEYLSCDRLPIKVLINCEDRYPIEYEGVYLPNQHRIYAYNKVNEFLLTGVVIPGTGVYIARVENKNSFPLLYMATAKEDGSPGWYYGEYGEGRHPANCEGLSFFDYSYEMRKFVVKIKFDCGQNTYGSEMLELLNVIRNGSNLNSAFLKGMEDYHTTYKNYLHDIFEKLYCENIDSYGDMDRFQ